MHPRWLRCSSLKYSRYSRSSRLAIGAPRPSRCDARLSPRAGSEASPQTDEQESESIVMLPTVATSQMLRISGEPSGSAAARPFDVGTDAKTGVLLEEYHHRPSRQGGFDDAQHRRYYPSPRLARSAVPRPAVSARVPAQAADVRRPLLLLA